MAEGARAQPGGEQARERAARPREHRVDGGLGHGRAVARRRDAALRAAVEAQEARGQDEGAHPGQLQRADQDQVQGESPTKCPMPQRPNSPTGLNGESPPLPAPPVQRFRNGLKYVFYK